MSAPLLGREQILGVLRDLAEELDRQGVRAEVFLVGGAAMTLAYNTRRATRDVDAIFEPKQTVYAAARRVAESHGLPEDWLNDAVKGFLHGEDPDAVPVLDRPASPARTVSGLHRGRRWRLSEARGRGRRLPQPARARGVRHAGATSRPS